MRVWQTNKGMVGHTDRYKKCFLPHSNETIVSGTDVDLIGKLQVTSYSHLHKERNLKVVLWLAGVKKL